MKPKSFIIILLVTFLLVSCDPGMVNNYVIENQSEYNIKVITKLNKLQRSISEQDSISRTYLKTSDAKKIASYGQIGNAYDKGPEFLKDIDVLVIETENLKLVKNVYSRSNWKLDLKKSIFGMDEANYTLIIENKDFN